MFRYIMIRFKTRAANFTESFFKTRSVDFTESFFYKFLLKKGTKLKIVIMRESVPTSYLPTLSAEK